MTQSEFKPASLGSIAEDSPDDFQFPKSGSGRRKLIDVESPAQTGTRRKKKSRRVKQFTTKADPELLESFYAVLDKIEVSTTVGFELAVKEFIKNSSA
ncbi:hypothetical protein [Shimia thalassica]|uniref:hypothetical protein n=1 Tax=Shimia thalassica TaxID=1715693 RepID=UPI0026E3A213|nr:hypothetical protein [Shimia thalassica]MDO6481872.1 hypothetical protein [Shimia thalassica]